jgi:hypothetical protein
LQQGVQQSAAPQLPELPDIPPLDIDLQADDIEKMLATEFASLSQTEWQ